MLRVDFYEQYNNLFPNLFFKTMTTGDESEIYLRMKI